jgi:Lon protease-like protein
MVKEAAGKNGFVISLNQSGNEFACADWGAWVEIIDFEQLPDGLLGITVQSKRLVSLSNFFYEEDELLNADVTLLPHWTESKNEIQLEQLQKAYQSLLAEQPVLSNLYSTVEIENPQWLISRWLEILPLSYSCRKKLTEINSFELALNTVETIVLGK